MDPSRRSEPSGRAGDLAATHPEYSTLFVIWPEAQPPLEEEIRLALTARWPELEQVDELDVGPDLLWGVTWRVPGAGGGSTDHLVWAEPRGDLTDTLLSHGLGRSDEYEAARRCRWLLGIETRLDPARPLSSFQEQLRFASEVAVPGLVALYDDNALVIRSGRAVEDLCRCTVPPRSSTLYAAHEVEGANGKWWLHTHGLLRVGLPDLDFVDLPADTLKDAHEFLHVVVDALLARVERDANGIITIGDGLQLRLLTLDEAMPVVGQGAVGGPGDRQGEMSDHAGDRLVILDPVLDVPPIVQMRASGTDATLFKSLEETRRQQKLSQSRWGTFGQLYAMHRRTGQWRFNVKLAYRQRSRPFHEHLWFEVLGLKPDRIHGRLLNQPIDVPDLRIGQEIWQSLDRMTDWLIVAPDGLYDPEAASVLLEES